MRANLVRIGLAAGIIAIVAIANGPQAGDAKAPAAANALSVADSATVIQRAVARYVKDKEDVDGVFTLRSDTEDRWSLKYHSDTEGVPSLTIYIDSEVTWTDKDKKPMEKAVTLSGTYVLPAAAKTPAARAKILELNNAWLQEKWVPNRIYLDDDGDVCLETYLNIPSPETPIPAEQVRNALDWMVGQWGVYYKRLGKIVELPAVKPPTTSQPAGGSEGTGVR